jgi:hypothetical protein
VRRVTQEHKGKAHVVERVEKAGLALGLGTFRRGVASVVAALGTASGRDVVDAVGYLVVRDPAADQLCAEASVAGLREGRGTDRSVLRKRDGEEGKGEQHRWWSCGRQRQGRQKTQ